MRSVQLPVLPRSFGLSVVKNEASSRTAGGSEADCKPALLVRARWCLCESSEFFGTANVLPVYLGVAAWSRYAIAAFTMSPWQV